MKTFVQQFVIGSRAGLIVLSFACMGCAPRTNLTESEYKESYKVLENLSLGIEKPGVHLDYIVREGELQPQPHYIRLTHAKGSFFLETFSQMQGYVKITNEEQALRFVRVFDPFLDVSMVYEVKVGSKHPEMKSFPNRLTVEQFRQGGFTPASVKKTPVGYVVTRWVFTEENAKPVLYKVEETITGEGDYKWRKIATMPPPPIHGVLWFLYHPK